MKRPLIKICGIRDEDTARFTAEAGADFIGFVHYPASPRHVSIHQAALLSKGLDDSVRSVLLLVDPDDALLGNLKKVDCFDLVQLHGSEAPERVSYIASYLDRPVIKALRIGSHSDLAQVNGYETVADWLLLDSKPQAAHLPGGTGESFDWRILEDFCPKIPWMLSGGLNKSNIENALSFSKPCAVDVSSGVETIRGEKDVKKIKAFIDVLKNADITNI